MCQILFPDVNHDPELLTMILRQDPTVRTTLSDAHAVQTIILIETIDGEMVLLHVEVHQAVTGLILGGADIRRPLLLLMTPVPLTPRVGPCPQGRQRKVLGTTVDDIIGAQVEEGSTIIGDHVGINLVIPTRIPPSTIQEKTHRLGTRIKSSTTKSRAAMLIRLWDLRT